MQRQSKKKHRGEYIKKADMQVLWEQPSHETIPGAWEDMHRIQQDWPFPIVCRSRRTRAMNKVEQEAVQNDARENIELVNINSIQFNKNQYVLTASSKMSTGQSNIMVLYKIDTGSNGNILSLHVYKQLFPSIKNDQLATAQNKFLLRTYS